MRLLLLCASMALACASSTSSAPDNSASVGGSAEALRSLGQRDARHVEECRAKVADCTDDAGSADRFRCERVSKHCDDLADQLASDRAELEQCLEAAVACEETAIDPADCESLRDACRPTDRQFNTRRGRTLECASKAEQCLQRGDDDDARADRRSNDGDAGAAVCDDDATDFVGCCRGKHRDRGDAGVNDEEFGSRGDRFGRSRDEQGGGKNERDDAVDAGRARRSRF
jgi:hypothetical protein